MSLYGALFSGVSGLAAQSSAMGAIADNVSNVNTIGYKGTANQFQTLVTKQVSLTRYSPGGVQSKPRASIDVQGLLSSTNSSTDLGVSGQGFFVVNQAANPVSGNMWAYTRAGSFKMDAAGYLTNTGGFYLQAWSLLPHDNSEGAATVVIDGISYMKAYQDRLGSTTYINDNIIDSRNLKPINLNTIGGSANPTKQISMGANLPAGAPVYDPQNPDQGGLESLAVLIYDSLGNAHNVNFEFTKESSNSWGIDAKMPSGAATTILYSTREISGDFEDDVYSARAQLEFTEIPQNHSYVKITDNYGETDARTYVYEFTSDGTTSYAPAPGETVVAVDTLTGIVVPADVVKVLQQRILETMPCGARFGADEGTLSVNQSLGGSKLAFDCSSCLEIKQSAANPHPITGIPSGTFNLPEIDWALKNVGRIDFIATNPDDYASVARNTSMIIDNQIYEFTRTGSPAAQAGNIAINIDGAISGGVVNNRTVVSLLAAAINSNAREPDRFIASGTSLEFHQSTSGQPILISSTDGPGAGEGSTRLRFDGQDQADYEGLTLTLGGITYTFDSTPTLPTDVDISGVTWNDATTAQQVMNMLKATINQNDTTPDRFQSNTNSLIFATSLMGANNLVDTVQLNVDGINESGTAIKGMVKNGGAQTPVTFASSPVVISKRFTYNGQVEAEDDALAAGVRFSSDGTPKYFNVQNMSIQWATGAQDMIGSPEYGSKINLFLGNSNTPDGLTHLAGDFIPNYISQDGAKFGNFAGVSIGQNGIVTALFDNGDTRPIAMIPLATFTNMNGLESLTGNSWIETDFSGMPTLRQAGVGGAGTINAATLESSTVDLGEEFSTMITTQRAYSAAAKIITTADEMLDELIRIKR